MRRAVFLDRDGVINRAIVRAGKPYPPASLRDVKILPGVPEAIKKLHNANYLIVVVTNQPDVARGIIEKKDVELINEFLFLNLQIDDIMTCYHDTKDECGCRKPLPGALMEAAKIYNIDLSKSFMVGDRWRDIEAGTAAGCKTFYINYNYSEKKPDKPDFVVSSLLEAEKIITRKY